MAHSFSRNHVHLVFSTKDRRNTIAKEWQPRLWAYLAAICKNHEMIALAVGGTENHAHILLHLPPKLALAKAVLLLKANSSKWMGEQRNDFSWQVRIRSIQRQFIEPRSGNSIHPEAGGAPPDDEFRGRIPRAASEAWRGIRSEIHFWLVGYVPRLWGLTLPRERLPTASAMGYDLSSLAGLAIWLAMCRPCGA
jgi:REP element-mobilizing transposase RayT